MHLLLCAMLPLVATLHLTYVAAASVAAAAESSDTASSASAALMTGSSSSRQKRESRGIDWNAFKDHLASMEDDDLSQFDKKSCAMGLNSHHCAIAHLDDIMKSSDYLNSGWSPGKRSSQAELLGRDLSIEQKKAVMIIRRLMDKMRTTPKQKRTCGFRLGNHCLTQDLDEAANQYFFLQSPASPGRRRRQATTAGEQTQGGDGESRRSRLRLRRGISTNSLLRGGHPKQRQTQTQTRSLFTQRRRR